MYARLHPMKGLYGFPANGFGTADVISILTDTGQGHELAAYMYQAIGNKGRVAIFGLKVIGDKSTSIFILKGDILKCIALFDLTTSVINQRASWPFGFDDTI